MSIVSVHISVFVINSFLLPSFGLSAFMMLYSVMVLLFCSHCSCIFILHICLPALPLLPPCHLHLLFMRLALFGTLLSAKGQQ